MVLPFLESWMSVWLRLGRAMHDADLLRDYWKNGQKRPSISIPSRYSKHLRRELAVAIAVHELNHHFVHGTPILAKNVAKYTQ
jgi:hypothetical protein